MRKLWISLILLILTTFVLSACGGAPATTAPAAPATSAPAAQPTKAAAGMTHDANPMSDNSYDVHFIDSTLDHHTGVIQMAQQALKESNTVAIKDLAQKTMTATQKEIDWLKAYRQKNHPNAAPMKDDMANMGAMGISMDASKPFDTRFAMAMIDHHKGSITMAKEALTKVGHDDLKQFAQTMLTAEQSEVAQLEKYAK
jgi:uncharacterized protein (DUF305 family)